MSLNGGGNLTASLKQEPVLERLRKQRIEAKNRLDNLDIAIDALEKNPDITIVLDSLTKLGHY